MVPKSMNISVLTLSKHYNHAGVHDSIRNSLYLFHCLTYSTENL